MVIVMKKERVYLLFISMMFGIVFNIGNPIVPIHTSNLLISTNIVGIILASTGLGLFLFSTFWGAIGDIKDRNKVIGIAFFGFSIGQFIFGLALNEFVLIGSALVSGLFAAGVLVNIYSYINDNFENDYDRNKMLSYAVSLTLAGASFGYLIGGKLGVLFEDSIYYVFIIQAIIGLLVGVFIYFEKTNLIDTDHHLTRRHFYINMKQVFKLPWLPTATITLTFFISFSHNNVKRYFDFYFLDSNYSTSQLGFIIFVIGIVCLITNLFIAPLLLKRLHNLRILNILFLFVPVLLFLSFYNGTTLLKFYTFFIFYHFFMAIYEPTAISLMSKNRAVPQGILVGVRQSIVGLGMTIGLIVGGYLYEINNLYVFYFAVLFYIIVFVGFTIISVILNKEIVEYNGGKRYD